MSDKKIKVGIWGLGRAGNSMHGSEINSFSDMFEIAAVCDIDPERCELMKKSKAPNARTYTDGDAFLQDKDILFIVDGAQGAGTNKIDIKVIFFPSL